METHDQNLLFEKYLNNQATAEETRQLLQSFEHEDESQLRQLILEKLQSVDYQPKTGSDEDVVLERVYSRVKADIRKKPFLLWYKVAAAACVVLVGGYLYFSTLKTKYVDKPTAIALNTARPGNDDAILTLADGKKIQINTASDGVIAVDAGATIRKTSAGEIVYDASGNVQGGNAQNTIETPKGRQFKLQLPDGTMVWLNAESSIKYPVSFSSAKERLVSITGEAYFEVSHDKEKPFRVKSALQTVEVLGTHFNINSYPDEGKTVTSLEEGSVKVLAGRSHATIRPGQQSIYLAGKPLSVKPADLRIALAWKSGKFKYRDATMPEIMRQIERWYDIEVKYRGAIPTDLYTGTISRDADLEQVLQIFKITQVQFELVQSSKGRTLFIKP